MNGPRHFNYLTEDIIKSGTIEIYSTPEDLDKISSINLYNQYMKECRQKMMELRILRYNYLIVNICMIIVFMLAKYVPIMMEPQAKIFYIRLVLDILLVIIHLILGFIYCLWKDELEFLPNIVTTAVLLFVNYLFGFLLLTNIIFCGIYRYKKGYLGLEPGYPLFCDLRIERIRRKKSESI